MKLMFHEPSDEQVSRNVRAGDNYSILLVCDFREGSLARILDVYRFFAKAPSIVLVRRGGRVATNPELCIRSEVIPLPVPALEGSLLHALSAICTAIGYLLYALVLFAKIRRDGLTIRLVHAHYILPQGLFGLILARLLAVPLIVSAAGGDVNLLMRSNLILRETCRFILARARVTIAVSRPLQRMLSQFGVRNCVYVPNSVNTSSITPRNQPSSRDSILFVSYMTEVKRPLLLLRAFERVLEAVPTATLTMVGSGPLSGAVQEEIRRKALDGKVSIIPSTTSRHVEELLSQSRIFVLPSLSEGLSYALLEAMAAGKVIVASANESHKAILQDECHALLFQLDNERDLADRIVTALTNRQLQSRLSESARELCVTEFSNVQTAKQLEHIYRTAIS